MSNFSLWTRQRITAVRINPPTRPRTVVLASRRSRRPAGLVASSLSSMAALSPPPHAGLRSRTAGRAAFDHTKRPLTRLRLLRRRCPGSQPHAWPRSVGPPWPRPDRLNPAMIGGRCQLRTVDHTQVSGDRFRLRPRTGHSEHGQRKESSNLFSSLIVALQCLFPVPDPPVALPNAYGGPGSSRPSACARVLGETPPCSAIDTNIAPRSMLPEPATISPGAGTPRTLPARLPARLAVPLWPDLTAFSLPPRFRGEPQSCPSHAHTAATLRRRRGNLVRYQRHRGRPWNDGPGGSAASRARSDRAGSGIP